MMTSTHCFASLEAPGAGSGPGVSPPSHSFPVHPPDVGWPRIAGRLAVLHVHQQQFEHLTEGAGIPRLRCGMPPKTRQPVLEQHWSLAPVSGAGARAQGPGPGARRTGPGLGPGPRAKLRKGGAWIYLVFVAVETRFFGIGSLLVDLSLTWGTKSNHCYVFSWVASQKEERSLSIPSH